MKNKFEVSVIIPVYNAEKFIERSINSALEQDEVKEVILVDDGYADGALDICKHFASINSRVRLLQHPDGKNQGAGASRNYGILHANCEYIAFLDADDYFLPNRFKNTKEAFYADSQLDAVYEPVGIEFTSSRALESFARLQNISSEQATSFITYPNTPLSGQAFFESLILLNNGESPCTDGLTIKKHLFSIVGLFNVNLRLHQDSELWIRLAHRGNFSPVAKPKIIAVRTMHEENRIYNKNNKSKLKYYNALLGWATQVDLQENLLRKIFTKQQLLISKNQSTQSK